MKRSFYPIFHSEYFRRLFLSYLIVTLLLTCLCGAVLYNKARQAEERTQEQDSRTRLNQVKTYMEELYPAIYKNAFISDILTTMDTPGGYDDAFTSFYKENGHNIYRIYQVASNLKAMMLANPGTENVSVYFKNLNLMVDPYAYYKVAPHSPKYELLTELDQGHTATGVWLPRSVSYGENSADELLTYIYTFPIQAHGGDISGYMFIDIYKSHANSLPDSLQSSDDEKLMMIDRSRNFAAATSNVSGTELEAYRAKLARLPSGAGRQDGLLFSVIGGDVSGSGPEWTFASIRPAQSLSFFSYWMNPEVLLVSSAVLLLVMLFTYYLTVKTYRPVRQMLHKLRETNSALLPDHQHNEFKMIEQVLTGLNHTVKQLSGQLDDKKLAALLSGSLTGNELPVRLQKDCCYLVVNVKVYRDSVKGWKTKWRKLAPPLAHEIIEKNGTELSLLLFIGLDERSETKNQLKELLHRMLQPDSAKGASFAAGVGGIVCYADDIPKSYEQAASALRYLFMEEFNPIVDYDDIRLRSGIPAMNYEPLENALRAGDVASAEQHVDEFADTLKRDTWSLEAVEFCLMQMMMVLSKVMIDLNSQEQMFPTALLFQDLRRETFADTIREIRQLCMQIGSHIQRHLKENAAQDDIFHKLKAYIDGHLSEDISLDRLSDMAGLSTAYLSRQFKEVHGVSFLDYMTHARMERACELLRTDAGSVTGIAGQVGYGNVPYFCTKFKSKYGVTPMQYRNSYRLALKE